MEALERKVVDLERELVRRDITIRQLRADLDKCHQVIRSSAAAAAAGTGAGGSANSLDPMAQIAPWRVPTASTASSGGVGGWTTDILPRLKRLAISAEPLLPRALGNAPVAELLRQTSLTPYLSRQKPKSAQWVCLSFLYHSDPYAFKNM